MKTFHLNRGDAFSQPYESLYSMMRRCFNANLGIPYSTIMANLRTIFPGRSSILDRIAAIQVSALPAHLSNEYIEHHYSYKWQCPTCAQNLYHTDIFAMPWVVYCPIHQNKITRKCPVCRRAWPSPDELMMRDCSCCGMLSNEQLARVLNNRHKQSYQPISDIYNLISSTPMIVESSFSDQSGGRVDWLEYISISNKYYPCLKLNHDHELAILSKYSRSLYECDVLCKTFLIQETNDINELFLHNSHPRPWYMCEGEISKKHVMAIYRIASNVADWIAKHTSNNHEIHLSTYRYMKIQDLFGAKGLCPYCMAYSIWFYHVQAVLYGIKTVNTVDDYPFCENDDLYDFFSGIEPVIYAPKSLSNNGSYVLKESGSMWFYCRGLELSFIDILRFTLRLRNKLREYWLGNIDYYPISNFNRGSSSRIYSASVIDERLYFYYIDEHPLNKIKAKKIPFIRDECIKYQQFHSQNRRDRGWSKFQSIPGSGLTYDMFLSHHTGFKKFLQQLVPEDIDMKYLMD